MFQFFVSPDTTRGAGRRLAAALLLTAASAAQASGAYSVGTFANTGRGYLRGCAAEYNVGGTGASFINNDGSHSPCHPADYLSQQNAVVTVSGTTDTTGRATKAFDTSSVVALPDSAYATSRADLKTGKVHLFASAAGFSSAVASAELSDTLHFTVAGATATTVSYVPVSFAFDGKIPGTANPATSFGELMYRFTFGNAQTYEFGDYAAGYFGDYGYYPTFVYSGPATVNGWVSSSFASYSPTDTRFTGVYALTGASADVPIDFYLGLNATKLTLDFSNTGTVSIGHVAGVSFTSDSGVFLTGHEAGGVPEPAAWALMMAGFAMVGTAARRRQRAVIAA